VTTPWGPIQPPVVIGSLRRRPHCCLSFFDRSGELLEWLFGELLDRALDGGTDTVTVGSVDGGFSITVEGSGVDPQRYRGTVDPLLTDRRAAVSEVARAHGWDAAVTVTESGGARVAITGIAGGSDPD